MDINALLKEFDSEVVNRGKAYFLEGRVLRLEELTPGRFKAFVSGTQPYKVTIELCPSGDAEYDCDCPYFYAPFCKHVVAALFSIDAGEYEKGNDLSSPEEALDPLSEEALSALPASRLAKLLCEVVNEYPEAGNWLRVRLSGRKDDMRAYRNLIRDSIISQMDHGYVPYNRIHNALRGAWTAVDYLDELSHEADFAHTMEFAVMIITEVWELSECSDEDGDVGGVVAHCMNWGKETYENRICHESESVQTAFFRCLIEWTRNSKTEDWWMPDDDPLEICTRIADTIPALRDEVMEVYCNEMNVNSNEPNRIWEYSLEKAQSTYYSLLLRWKGEEAALKFAHEHLNNNRLCVFLFENMLAKEQYQDALALCMQAEGRAAEYLHLFTVEEWKHRRYELYQRIGAVAEQRSLGEELLLSGAMAYYKKLENLYTARQWRQKRQQLLDILKNNPHARNSYIDIITDDGDKPRILDFVREFPDRILNLYQHLLPEYMDEVNELFYTVLKRNAEMASDRKGYNAVCLQIYSYYKACGIANATALIAELRTAYPRRRAFQEELRSISERINGED